MFDTYTHIQTHIHTLTHTYMTNTGSRSWTGATSRPILLHVPPISHAGQHRHPEAPHTSTISTTPMHLTARIEAHFLMPQNQDMCLCTHELRLHYVKGILIHTVLAACVEQARLQDVYRRLSAHVHLTRTSFRLRLRICMMTVYTHPPSRIHQQSAPPCGAASQSRHVVSLSHRAVKQARLSTNSAPRRTPDAYRLRIYHSTLAAPA
jgi:hypothetical protein